MCLWVYLCVFTLNVCVCKCVCVLGAMGRGGFLLVSAHGLHRERGVQGKKMGELGI